MDRALRRLQLRREVAAAPPRCGSSFGTNTRLRWTFQPRGDLFVVYHNSLRELDNRWQKLGNQLLVKLQYTLRR